MTTQYNTAALRDLISAALGEDEFTALAFDHFRPIYDQFAAGQTRNQRVQLLLEHTVRSGQMARLAALLFFGKQPHHFAPHSMIRLARLG